MYQATDLQTLTRCLLAAGYAENQGGKEQYLLYVNPEGSFLQCQQWTGKSLTKTTLVADSVRQNSTAAYLITPAGKLVIVISPTSAINAYIYDDEEREWVESDEGGIEPLPPYVVHPEGKLASSVDPNGRVHTVFQDQSRHLTYLDNSWSSTTLPVSPEIGSALSISATGDALDIFYVSAKDNFVHNVTGVNGSWKDRIAVKHVFETGIEGLVLAKNESQDKELYVMTKDSILLKISADERLVRLGTVKMGEFISERSVDYCEKDAWNGTLTEDDLKGYLANDPSCIDAIGSEHSVTPLGAACIRGQLEVVRFLLRHHANPNALSPKKRTPLFYATSTSEGRDRCAIVRALLEAGANVDECYAENGFNTPLMNAITLISDQEVVDELLKHGASPNSKDLAGHSVETLAKGTPMEAIVSEHLEQANSSPLERQIVEFIVALLMFIVAYTNNRKIKFLVDQIFTKLNDMNVAGDERTPKEPVSVSVNNSATTVSHPL